jgi:hypothetical protein
MGRKYLKFQQKYAKKKKCFKRFAFQFFPIFLGKMKILNEPDQKQTMLIKNQRNYKRNAFC